jgi:membrane-bound ClpP family serine protease
MLFESASLIVRQNTSPSSVKRTIEDSPALQLWESITRILESPWSVFFIPLATAGGSVTSAITLANSILGNYGAPGFANRAVRG